MTWVDSFTGRTLDLAALGAVCRQAGALLVVNASQALGARPLSLQSTPVDAVVSCGYKWLCGPYGTGFTWLHPDLLERLRPQQAYWLAMQAGRGLDQMRETTIRDDIGVHALMSSARPALLPPCPGSPRSTCSWVLASMPSPTGISG